MKIKKNNLIKSIILKVGNSEKGRNNTNTFTHIDYVDLCYGGTFTSNKTSSKFVSTPMRLSNLKNYLDHNQLRSVSNIQTGRSTPGIEESPYNRKKIVLQKTNCNLIKTIRDISEMNRVSKEKEKSSICKTEIEKELKKNSRLTRFNFDSDFLRANWDPLKGFFKSTKKINEQYFDIENKNIHIIPKIRSNIPDLNYNQVDKLKLKLSSLNQLDCLFTDKSSI